MALVVMGVVRILVAVVRAALVLALDRLPQLILARAAAVLAQA
jgi:hypothetical protein